MIDISHRTLQNIHLGIERINNCGPRLWGLSLDVVLPYRAAWEPFQGLRRLSDKKGHHLLNSCLGIWYRHLSSYHTPILWRSLVVVWRNWVKFNFFFPVISDCFQPWNFIYSLNAKKKTLNCLLKEVGFSIGGKSIARRVSQKTLEVHMKVKNVKQWSLNFLFFCS